MTAGDSSHERGMKIRREVLGDEHVDAAVARTTRGARSGPDPDWTARCAVASP
jgi:hypothetical protein